MQSNNTEQRKQSAPASPPWRSRLWNLTAGVALAALLSAGVAQAATVNVSTVAQLVSAVNNGAAGDTINVAAGTYVLSASLTPKASMIIKGAGSASTILKPASSWNPGTTGLPEDPVGINSADPTTYMFNLGGNDGIKISGMTLDGLQQLHGAILITYDGKNHEFFNLDIKNYWVAGVRGFSIQSSSIHDNTISITIYGHWEFTACIYLAWPSDMQIYNNRITGTCFGIKLRQDVRSHIYNNTIMNDGFSIEAPFDNNQDSEYDHNYFKSPVSIPKEGGGSLPASGIQNHIHHNYFMPAYAIEFARNGVEIDHNFFDLMAAGWEDGRLISAWCGGPGPCKMHDNLIKDPGYGVFFSTTANDNFHFYNNHVIANPTPQRQKGGLFDFPGGTTWNTIWIKDNIIDCTTLARPLMKNTAGWAAVIQNNTLINVSDSGKYTNPNTGAKRGPLAPLNFTCGVKGEYTVKQWTVSRTGGGTPSAPSGLSARAVASSQMNLNWTDNATNETGFKIERKTGPGGTYAQIATVGDNRTVCSDTGLSANTQYYYRVRSNGGANNSTGDSAYSNETNATTLPAGTQSPYGGTARAVPGTIEAEDFDFGGEGVAYHDTDIVNQGRVCLPRCGGTCSKSGVVASALATVMPRTAASPRISPARQKPRRVRA